MANAEMSESATARAAGATGEVARSLAREERRRHLRVVRPENRPWLRIRLTPRVGIGVTVLLFVALFAVAASHALLIAGQGRLDRLDQQVSEEQARYEALRADVSALESPERILEEAERLGMVPAEGSGWLVQSRPVETGEDGPGDSHMPATSQVDAPRTHGCTIPMIIALAPPVIVHTPCTVASQPCYAALR
jgi:hypothetical protein